MFLDCIMAAWMTAALGMSLALTKHYPDMGGWDNISRAVAWPVTLWEVNQGLL